MALSTIPMHLLLESDDINGSFNAHGDDTGISAMGRQVSLKAHKQLPRKWDLGVVEDSPISEESGELSDLPESSTSDATNKDAEMTSKSSENPILPPTPPGAPDGEHGREEILSAPVTPPIQQSPPTPDITPPRRFLGAQTSMTSTRAESFRTAREDFISDDENESMRFSRKSPASTLRSGRGRYTPTHHINQPLYVNGISHSLLHDSVTIQQPSNDEPVLGQENAPAMLENEAESARQLDNQMPSEERENGTELQDPSVPTEHATPEQDEEQYHERIPQRGLSLRDRLKVQQMTTPSTERFGDAIGWVDEGMKSLRDSRRISEASPPSTVEAMVFDTPTIPKRNQTLRHRGKTDSLRAFSSPLPSRNNRDSIVSNFESSPLLHHKKVRLSNQNRWSYGSEASRSFSISSSGVLPRAEAEVIKVAVVPDRRSSLRSSANSSKGTLWQSRSSLVTITILQMPIIAVNEALTYLTEGEAHLIPSRR